MKKILIAAMILVTFFSVSGCDVKQTSSNEASFEKTVAIKDMSALDAYKTALNQMNELDNDENAFKATIVGLLKTSSNGVTVDMPINGEMTTKANEYSGGTTVSVAGQEITVDLYSDGTTEYTTLFGMTVKKETDNSAKNPFADIQTKEESKEIADNNIEITLAVDTESLTNQTAQDILGSVTSSTGSDVSNAKIDSMKIRAVVNEDGIIVKWGYDVEISNAVEGIEVRYTMTMDFDIEILGKDVNIEIPSSIDIANALTQEQVIAQLGGTQM